MVINSLTKRAISLVLSFALCISMTTLTGLAAGEGDILYENCFDTDTNLSDFNITNNGSGTAYKKLTDDGMIEFGKTAKGSSEDKMELDFASYVEGISTYLVSMDMIASISSTVNIRLGGTIALRHAGDGLYTVEWHNGSSWNTEDKTTYNVGEVAKFRFVVKNQEKIDVYIGNALVKGDIPCRNKQPFTKLGFDLGKSMVNAHINLDNIVVTADTTIEQLPEPEPEPEPEPGIENGVTTSDIPTVGAPDVAKEAFDLYLAIGQSNMAGRAPVEEQDRISIPNVYLLNAEDEWETAQAQYVDGKWYGFNRYSTVRKTEAVQGVNPAFYFAKTLAENVAGENKKIGIISNARGDTSIDAWQKGYSHDTKDYDLYEEAVRRAKAAMETGTLKGIIWHQGCANLATNPDEYIEKFKTLVSDLRADLGIADLPIIIGEIPGFGDTVTKADNRKKFNKNCISKLPSAVDNCWYVSSAGSRDIGDKTHFETVSQRRLGTLYAEIALDKIYGITSGTFNKVPLVVTSSSDGAVAADGVADIHSWGDDTSYWGGTAGSVWTADFAQPVTVEKIKSYFRDPYNYVAQYKIYLGNEGSWTLVADNSGITDYPYIDKNSAVIDDVQNIVADSIKVEITGGADLDGAAFADVIGCHEFEVLTSGDVFVYENDFDKEADLNDFKISVNNSGTAYADITTDGKLKFGKTAVGKTTVDSLEFDFASRIGNYSNYVLSMDLSADITKGQTVSIRLGGTIAIRHKGDGLYTIEFYDGSGWDTTSHTNTYNLTTEAKKLSFVIKDKKAIDVYIGNILVESDVPCRNNQPFTKLGIDLGKSAKGYVILDNIMITTDTAIKQDAYVTGAYQMNSAGTGYQLNIRAFVPSATAGKAFKAYVAYYADENHSKFIGTALQDVVPGEIVSRGWGSSIPKGSVSANIMLWDDALVPLCDYVTVELIAPTAE